MRYDISEVEYHMSKQKIKGNKLPPLQKKVILCLAHEGPQTKNKIVTNLPPRAHYKSTWLSIKSLTQKGLIQEVGTKEYNKRKYPTHWLTYEGIFVALIEGANPETLLNKARETFPKNQTLLYFLEMASKLNPKIFGIAYSALKTKGTLTPFDLFAISLTQMQTETTMQTFRELMEILRKKFPKLYNSTKENIEKISQTLNQLKETI